MMTNKQLTAYNAEMGLFVPLTIKLLIKSHRRLRADSMIANDERRREITAACERAKQAQMSSEWIKIESLKSMSVMELVRLLYDEDE